MGHERSGVGKDALVGGRDSLERHKAEVIDGDVLSDRRQAGAGLLYHLVFTHDRQKQARFEQLDGGGHSAKTRPVSEELAALSRSHS